LFGWDYASIAEVLEGEICFVGKIPLPPLDNLCALETELQSMPGEEDFDDVRCAQLKDDIMPRSWDRLKAVIGPCSLLPAEDLQWETESVLQCELDQNHPPLFWRT
jgi:hypothetical protein